MTGYLGTTARMVAAVPASAQSEARPDRFVIQQAASRRWAFDTARRGGVQGREWAVELGLLDAVEMMDLYLDPGLSRALDPRLSAARGGPGGGPR